MRTLRVSAIAALCALFIAASADEPEPTVEELKAKNAEGENWEGPHVPEIVRMEDMERVLEESKTAPIFIFKHSTQCPINARAAYRTNQFLEDAPESTPKFYFVKVIERRPVSLQIAEKTGVKHESPQLLLIDDGKAVWDSDHEEITAEAVSEAIAKHAAKE